MSKRILTLICVGLVSTMFVACGDEDPSKNNTANNGDNNGNNNGTVVNNGTTPNNNGTVVNNGTTPNNNGTVVNNGTTPTNNGVACARLDNFYGQIAGSGDHDGGVPVADLVLDYDANLSAVSAAMPATPSTSSEPDAGKAAVDIDVTGALVTATFFDAAANTVFWVQDSMGTMRIRLPQGTAQPTPIVVGSRVSFTVTEVTNFENTPQISNLTNVVEDSAGNEVPYTEANGTDLTIGQFNHIVRLWGTITADTGSCGGSSICYTIEHGGDATRTTVLRTSSTFIEVGDCVTFTGPLSSFPGPLDTDANHTIQVDQTNFGWLFEQN